MANQKANLKDIALETVELNVSKNKSIIKQYSGFRKQNSPYYGNVLSPFYKREYNNTYDGSFVYQDGSIYSIDTTDSILHLRNGEQDVGIYNLSNTSFLTKKELLTTGNTVYTKIEGVFKSMSGELNYLASDLSSNLAELNEDGTIIREFPISPIPYLTDNIQIYCIEKIGNDLGLVICTNNNILVFDYTLNTISEYLLPNNIKAVTYRYVDTGSNKELCFCLSVNNTSVILLSCNFDTKIFTTCTHSYISFGGSSILAESTNIIFNNKGECLFLSSIAKDSNNLYTTGNLTGITYSGGGATIFEFTVNNSIYTNNTTIYTSNNFFLDNNNLYSVVEWYHISNSLVYNEKNRYKLLKESTEPLNVEENGQLVEKVVQTLDTTGDLVVNSWDSENNITTLGIGLYLTLLNMNGIFPNIPVDSSILYQGGLSSTVGAESNEPTLFRYLYNNGELQGISCIDSIHTNTIGTLLNGLGEIDSSYNTISNYTEDFSFVAFHDNKKWIKVEVVKDINKAKFEVANNRYIILNTIEYYNCFDMKNLIWYHACSDWNDRTIFSRPQTPSNTYNSIAKYINACKLVSVASSQNLNYGSTDSPFISTLFSATSGYVLPTSDVVVLSQTGTYTVNNQDIDTYVGYVETTGSNPPYFRTLGGNQSYYTNSGLQGTTYTVTNVIFIPSIFATYITTFANQGIISDNNKSYLQLYSESTTPVFGVDFISSLEGIESAFIIQGMYFVVIKDGIYRYNSDTSAITFIVNKGGMQYLGFTPYQAMFFSPINKTLYSFIGDNTLTPLTQATEINEVIYSTYNPNNSCMNIITDEAIYILNELQLIRLNLSGYTKSYNINSGLVFTSPTKVLYLSYNKIEGYEKMPIELETEFYGLGNSIKSINDCVYIRLFDEYRTEGKVKVKCISLNEISMESKEKVFNITKDMWDRGTNTIFLRYQPELQACTGFSVSIESPFPIATLQIGSTGETIQNSKYNI